LHGRIAAVVTPETAAATAAAEIPTTARTAGAGAPSSKGRPATTRRPAMHFAEIYEQDGVYRKYFVL
jgi:hypothetical protein